MNLRPTWDSIWEAVASQVGRRTLCSLASVGAVITDSQNRIVSTGYNGPPAGFIHQGNPCFMWCGRATVHRSEDDKCVAVHAEANALLSADRSRWQGGTIYINKHPCWECCKLIANSGLSRMVVRPVNPTPEGHHSEQTYDFMEQCGITVEVIGE